VAIKLKIPQSKKRKTKGRGFLGGDPVVRIALIVFAVLAIGITAVFSFYYVKYDRIIEHRFKGQIFSNSAKIYAIPKTVRVGQKISATQVAAELRQAGYTDSDDRAELGSYRLLSSGIEIKPGPGSYHSPEAARVEIQATLTPTSSSRS